MPAYEVNACETPVAEVCAADIYTPEMHARPFTSKWSRSCSDAKIAAEVASLIHPNGETSIQHRRDTYINHSGNPKRVPAETFEELLSSCLFRTPTNRRVRALPTCNTAVKCAHVSAAFANSEINTA